MLKQSSQLPAVLQPGEGPEPCPSPREAVAAGRATRAGPRKRLFLQHGPFPGQGRKKARASSHRRHCRGCMTAPFKAVARSACRAGIAWGGTWAAQGLWGGDSPVLTQDTCSSWRDRSGFPCPALAARLCLWLLGLPERQQL